MTLPATLRWSLLPFLALVLPSLLGVYGATGISWLLFGLLWLLLALLPALWQESSLPRLPRDLLLPALLTAGLALWWLVLLPFSIDPSSSLKTLVGLLAYAALLAWVVRISPGRQDLLTDLLLLGGVAAFLIATILYWGESSILPNPVMGGLFGNKNHFAGYLLLLLPLALTRLSPAGDRRTRLAYLLVSVLLSAGLFLSQSLGGWIAGLAVAATLLGTSARRGRAALRERVGVLSVAVLGGALLALLTGRGFMGAALSSTAAKIGGYGASLAASPGPTTLNDRLGYWRGAGELLQAFPLSGTGPGTFGRAFAAFEQDPFRFSSFAHNLWLQIGAESGVVGFLLAVGLAGSVLGVAWKALGAAGPGLPEGILAALVGAAVRNLGDLDLYIPAYGAPLMVVLGLLVSYRLPRTSPEWRAEEARLPGFARLLLAGVFLIPLVINPWGLLGFDATRTSLLRGLAPAGLVLWLWQRGSLRPDPLRHWGAPHLLLGSFAVWTLLTTFTAIDPARAWWGNDLRPGGSYSLLSLVVLAFLVAQALAWPRFRELLPRTILAAASLSAGVALLQCIHADPILGPPPGSRLRGLHGNSLLLGAFMAAALPWTLAWTRQALERWRGRRSVWLVVGLPALLQLDALFLTLGRGPMVGAVVGIIVLGGLYMLLRPRPTPAVWSYLAGVLILALVSSALLAPCSRGGAVAQQKLARIGALAGLVEPEESLSPPVALQEAESALPPAGGPSRGLAIFELRRAIDQGLDALEQRPRSTFRDDSITVRRLMWGGVLELVFQGPRWTVPDPLRAVRSLIGYGPGTLLYAFQAVYPTELAYGGEAGDFVDSSHNWVMDLLAEEGLIGLALMTGLLMAALVYALRRGGDLRGHELLRPAATASLAAYLVDGTFNVPVVETRLFLWIAIGALIGSIRPLTASRPSPTPMPKRRLRAIVAVGLAVVLAAPTAAVAADVLPWRGHLRSLSGQPITGQFMFGPSVRLAPWNSFYPDFARRIETFRAAGGTDLEERVAHLEEAERFARMAIGRAPLFSVYHRTLGDLYMDWAALTGEGQRYEQAVAAYSQAARLNPHMPQSYLNLAEALARAGRPQAALALLEAAGVEERFHARVEAVAAAAYSAVVETLAGEQELDRAEEALGEAERLLEGGAPPAAWLATGNAYLGADRFGEAERAFATAAERGDATGYLRLAEARMAQGRWREAHGPASEYVKIKPDDWRGHNVLSIVYYQLGEWEESLHEALVAYGQAPPEQRLALRSVIVEAQARLGP